MYAITRIGVITWSGVVALLPIMITAGVLRAQEVELAHDGSADAGPRLGLLAGLRWEVSGVPSPGINLDVILDSAERPVWLSVQVLAQMVRWNVRGDTRTIRDHWYLGRVRLGFGKRPRVYALYQIGTGVIKTDSQVRRGDTYDLRGTGLGVGLSVDRFTVSLEAVLGGDNRADPWLHVSKGVLLQYRVPALRARS